MTTRDGDQGAGNVTTALDGWVDGLAREKTAGGIFALVTIGAVERPSFEVDVAAIFDWAASLPSRYPGSVTLWHGGATPHEALPYWEAPQKYREAMKKASRQQPTDYTCVPRGELGEKTDWRDKAARFLYQARRAHLLERDVYFFEMAEATRPLWDIHVGADDCKHLCTSPFLAEPLLWAASAVLRGRLGVGTGTGTGEAGV